MEVQINGSANHPRIVTSRKRITYRPSSWRVHEFVIRGGEVSCRVAALRVNGGLLLWVGGAGEPQLGEIALGVPAPEPRLADERGSGSAGAGLATTLLGTEGTAVALARRLAVKFAYPVYVCAGTAFDRFTIPLIERGLISEIKSRPEHF